jgi:choloylglycine hydrolase
MFCNGYNINLIICATIEEVINTDTKLRIDGGSTPLHYLVTDAADNVATIEYLNGKMVVHKGNELPFAVLTNSTYAASAESANNFLKKKKEALPGNNSLDRFVKACGMIKQINETNISIPLTDYAFFILDTVSQGSYTVWSIVYDVSNKKILFKTARNTDIKTVNLNAFNFSCTSPSKMYNMNQEGNGDITSDFILPDTQLKQKIVDRAFSESSKYVSISDKQKEELLSYEMKMKCK